MCDCIRNELSNNLDTPVILFTESGCFQGLLVEVDDECVKLICCNGSRFFPRVTVIRIEDIEAVTFCSCFR